ncbi:hypothetical protein GCM10027429_32820 [Marivirga atlantica]|jgi:hypothetical protein|uniref:Deoxyribose-phosphate aldolase n=1 Tax=Marivirga atlantica TaxID=1548457 RepID=A0A937AI51_9BACT|nr:DUF6503 family protein [Marivirga atlantica]MBL0766859.1 hypothetical protein [Marivirga atlantica]
MKNYLLFISCLLIFSCNEEKESADSIIKNAIEYHGGAAYDSVNVEFQFRDKRYQITQNHGNFKYKRVFVDSLENVLLDILTNNGLIRHYNDSLVELSAKDSSAYANSVNSVQYFAMLPQPLSDPAVIASRKKDVSIKQKEYYSIEVKFSENNGGEDFEDIFMYWFDKEDYSMDYLAYQYNTDGGGVRFREAYNSRVIDDIIFQDYNNFKASIGTPLIELPTLFEQNKLELLSKIELEFIND